MRSAISIIFVLFANLSITSYAAAAGLAEGAIEASLSWRLGFGADKPVQTGYGFAIGYHAHNPTPSGEGTNIGSVDNEEVCGTENVPGVPDTCVPRDSGLAENLADARGLARVTDAAWLDAGTGHMGDLVAR